MNRIEPIETDRLILRELVDADFSALHRILGDPDVMAHYDDVADEAGSRKWLEGIRKGYTRDGHSFYAVELKENSEVIGICGLLMQPFAGKTYREIGYLFAKVWWHMGYATEAAVATRDYSFSTFEYDQLISVINPANVPSLRVAERNGMILDWIGTFQDVENAHVYGISRTPWDEIKPGRQDAE